MFRYSPVSSVYYDRAALRDAGVRAETGSGGFGRQDRLRGGPDGGAERASRGPGAGGTGVSGDGPGDGGSISHLYFLPPLPNPMIRFL